LLDLLEIQAHPRVGAHAAVELGPRWPVLGGCRGRVLTLHPLLLLLVRGGSHTTGSLVVELAGGAIRAHKVFPETLIVP
jgi:hypothetical protein